MNEDLLKQIEQAIAKLKELSGTIDSVDKDNTLVQKLEGIANSLASLSSGGVEQTVATLKNLGVAITDVTQSLPSLEKVPNLAPFSESVQKAVKDLQVLQEQISATSKEQINPKRVIINGSEAKETSRNLENELRSTLTGLEGINTDPVANVKKSFVEFINLLQALQASEQVTIGDTNKLEQKFLELSKLLSSPEFQKLDISTQFSIAGAHGSIDDYIKKQREIANKPIEIPVQPVVKPIEIPQPKPVEVPVVPVVEKTTVKVDIPPQEVKVKPVVQKISEAEKPKFTANEQVVKDAQEAIKALEAEKQKLLDLGKSTNLVDRNINGISQALKLLTGDSDKSASALQKAQNQLEKFLSSARSGETVRIRLPGLDTNTRLTSNILNQSNFGEVGRASKTLQDILDADKPKAREVKSPDLSPEKKAEEAFINELNKFQTTIFNKLKVTSKVKLTQEEFNKLWNQFIQDYSKGEIKSSTLSKLSSKPAIPKDAQDEVIADLEKQLKKRIAKAKELRALRQQEQEILARDSARNPLDFVDNLNTTSAPKNDALSEAIREREALFGEIDSESIRRQNQIEKDKALEDEAIVQMEKAIAKKKEQLAEEKKLKEERIRNSARDPLTYVNDLDAEQATRPLKEINILREQYYSQAEYQQEQYAETLASEAKAERNANKEMEKAIAEREKLMNRTFTTAQLDWSLPGGEIATKELMKRAQKDNPRFTVGAIKSVVTEPSTGVSKVAFEVQNAQGIFERTTYTVDKFGKVLRDNQRRFADFGSAIARDVLEFTKWSIALGIVMLPMQKLSELTQDMIENQSKLANVQISLGEATRSVNEIFRDSLDIAKQTGEDVSGVIEAYNLAYRATGGAAEGTERFALSNKLLADSITLSKLSGLDQAKALDLLTAALKQSGMGLDEGSKLLDKWVATTRVANVDLETLVTGFSVLGDSAKSAGLGADELNTVIALIAESSGQSAEEIANIARSINSGFQTDQARERLLAYGVALEDFRTGEAKNFIDVIKQINDLRDKGIIQPEDFTALTLEVGGGQRRQAAVSAFINSMRDMNKVSGIETASANAVAGTSVDALKVKLDTIETSLKNTGNAFKELAQAMGTDGGVLDIFGMLLKFITMLTEGLAGLTSALGRTAPILASTLLTAGVFNLKGPAFTASVQNGFGNFGGGLVTRLFGDRQLNASMGGVPLNRVPFNDLNAINYSAPIGPQPSLKTSSTNWFARNSGYFASAAIGVLPAIERFANEGVNDKSIKKASADIGGAIVGALVTGGNPIGAAVGSSIADAFVSNVLDYKPTLEGFFKEVFAPAPDSPEAKKSTESNSTKAFNLATKAIGGGVSATLAQGFYNAVGGVSSFFNGTGDQFKGFTREQAVLMELQGRIATMEQRGLQNTPQYQQFKQAFDEVIKLIQSEEAPKTLLNEKEQEVRNKFQSLLDQAIAQEQEKLVGNLADRRINPSTFKTAKATLSNEFGATASQLYGTFGESYNQKYGTTPQQFFNTTADLVGAGKKEEITQLSEYASMISQVDVELSKLTKGTSEYNIRQEEKNKIVEQAVTFMHNLNQEILASAEQMKTVDFSSYTVEEFKIIEAEAFKLRDAILAVQVSLGKLTEEQAQAIKDSYKPEIIQLKGGQLTTSTAGSEWLSGGEKQAKETSLIKSDQTGFEVLDMTMAQFNSAMSKYDETLKMLEQYGYKESPDTAGTIEVLKDGTQINHRDQKIVQYLLQQIEKNTSNLDGMYNLPEGASFWIPAQTAKLLPNANSGGVSPFSAPGKTTEEKVVTIRPTNYDEKLYNFKEKQAEMKSGDYGVTQAKYGPDEVAKAFREADLKSMNAVQKVQVVNFSEMEPNIAQSPRDADRAFSTYPDELKLPVYGPEKPADLKVPTQPDFQSFINQLINALKVDPNYRNPNLPQQVPLFGQSPAQPAFDFNGLMQGLSNLTTKLALSIDNRITVQLDGRVIASVVKNYIKNDLVRYSGNSATKSLNVI